MKAWLKAIVLVPLAVLALAFAVANRQVTTVSFDPFSAGEPAFALVAPLFVLVFVLLMGGVVIGGVASWLGQGRYRSAARRAQREADDLRDEVERLRTELAIQARQVSEASRTDAPSRSLPALLGQDA